MQSACFVVRYHSGQQEPRRSAAKLLRKDEARRIAGWTAGAVGQVLVACLRMRTSGTESLALCPVDNFAALCLALNQTRKLDCGHKYPCPFGFVVE
jgi:hypothetical protein